MRKFLHSVLPAFLLAVSVGQIYAFTNFSDGIAQYISTTDSPVTKAQVQFAFSLGIFFLGMGAAFFGRIVEKNIRCSTIVGSVLFLSGLAVTQLGVCLKSLWLIYLGYGVLLGTGTGVIYISPVKTMMLWFENNKAIAAAVPIISFGLGSTVSTLLYQVIESFGIQHAFTAYAAVYLPVMAVGCMLLKKPYGAEAILQYGTAAFDYRYLVADRFFLQSWLFMFLNISCGLCLIPLAKQMMATPAVGYSAGLVTAVVALSGVMSGAGRFVFAWLSDRLSMRINILLIILGVSAAAMYCAFSPIMIGITLLVINACYGAGFSVIPAILSDNYGMAHISKIHGAVLSAWGVAGLVGNQLAILVSDRLGFGYMGVVTMLFVLYVINFANAMSLRKQSREYIYSATP